MKIIFAPGFDNLSQRKKVTHYIDHFSAEGEFLNDGQRNSIKIFDLDGKLINIKSFKVPNYINRIAYRYFRKSKAERSFIYAGRLMAKGIGTPQPIAYATEAYYTFTESFYVSEQLTCDLTYRELVLDPNFPNHEDILRAFTRFTFELHENDVEFLDHSPGNTLIQLNNGDYKFFLVDLNRMNFRALDLEARMKNFSRLTPKKEMVEIMANEYAKFIEEPEEEVFEKMWFYTNEFQFKFKRKHELKKKIKFWKKK